MGTWVEDGAASLFSAGGEHIPGQIKQFGDAYSWSGGGGCRPEMMLGTDYPVVERWTRNGCNIILTNQFKKK